MKKENLDQPHVSPSEETRRADPLERIAAIKAQAANEWTVGSDDALWLLATLEERTRELKEAEDETQRLADCWQEAFKRAGAAEATLTAAQSSERVEIAVCDGVVLATYHSNGEAMAIAKGPNLPIALRELADVVMMELLAAEEKVKTALKQAACSHENRTGGNDYLLCNDCGLMWDYRREGPQDALKRIAEAALTASPADKEQK